jgi:hypothetical protein
MIGPVQKNPTMKSRFSWMGWLSFWPISINLSRRTRHSCSTVMSSNTMAQA